MGFSFIFESSHNIFSTCREKKYLMRELSATPSQLQVPRDDAGPFRCANSPSDGRKVSQALAESAELPPLEVAPEATGGQVQAGARHALWTWMVSSFQLLFSTGLSLLWVMSPLAWRRISRCRFMSKRRKNPRTNLKQKTCGKMKLNQN